MSTLPRIVDPPTYLTDDEIDDDNSQPPGSARNRDNHNLSTALDPSHRERRVGICVRRTAGYVIIWSSSIGGLTVVLPPKRTDFISISQPRGQQPKQPDVGSWVLFKAIRIPLAQNDHDSNDYTPENDRELLWPWLNPEDEAAVLELECGRIRHIAVELELASKLRRVAPLGTTLQVEAMVTRRIPRALNDGFVVAYDDFLGPILCSRGDRFVLSELINFTPVHLAVAYMDSAMAFTGIGDNYTSTTSDPDDTGGSTDGVSSNKVQHFVGNHCRWHCKLAKKSVNDTSNENANIQDNTVTKDHDSTTGGESSLSPPSSPFSSTSPYLCPSKTSACCRYSADAQQFMAGSLLLNTSNQSHPTTSDNNQQQLTNSAMPGTCCWVAIAVIERDRPASNGHEYRMINGLPRPLARLASCCYLAAASMEPHPPKLLLPPGKPKDFVPSQQSQTITRQMELFELKQRFDPSIRLRHIKCDPDYLACYMPSSYSDRVIATALVVRVAEDHALAWNKELGYCLIRRNVLTNESDFNYTCPTIGIWIVGKFARPQHRNPQTDQELFVYFKWICVGGLKPAVFDDLNAVPNVRVLRLHDSQNRTGKALQILVKCRFVWSQKPGEGMVSNRFQHNIVPTALGSVCVNKGLVVGGPPHNIRLLGRTMIIWVTYDDCPDHKQLCWYIDHWLNGLAEQGAVEAERPNLETVHPMPWPPVLDIWDGVQTLPEKLLFKYPVKTRNGTRLNMGE